MTRFQVALGFLLMLFASVHAGADSAKWQEFSSTEGRFAVLMPGTPTLTVTNDHTIVGTIVENSYDLTAPAGTFEVEYQDLPGIVMMFMSQKRLLQRAKGEFIKHFQATEVSDTEITIGELKGRRIAVEGPKKEQAQVILVMDGHRLYVVLLATPKDPADFDRFLSSFRLVKS